MIFLMISDEVERAVLEAIPALASTAVAEAEEKAYDTVSISGVHLTRHANMCTRTMF